MEPIIQTVQDILNERACKHELYTLSGPSRGWCTAIIIILTILVEVAVHANMKFSVSEEKKNSTPEMTANVPSEPQSQESPQAQDVESDKQNVESVDSVPPSAIVRANRLAVAIFLYIPLTVAFAFRMHEASSISHIHTSCHRYIPRGALPNWWILTIFVIVPFISASCAILRALVDCVLFRWGKTVSSLWTACMPLFVVAVLGLFIFEGVKWPIVVMMGRRELSLFAPKGREGEGEGEMRDETRRSVNRADVNVGVDGERSDGLPAYEEACRERKGTKMAGDVV